jgi:hypothetical protein
VSAAGAHGPGLGDADRTETALLAANIAASSAMAAIAWFCQLVQYPMLRSSEPEHLPEAARQHARRITPLVIPVMLAELAVCIRLLAAPPRGVRRRDKNVSAGLLTGIWLSTLAVQARQHAKLQERHDPRVLRALVRGNLPRTIAWTLRVVLAVSMLRDATANPGRP